MTTLTNDHSFIYNGVDFGVTTHLRRLSARPQLDGAGRLVVFVEYTFTVEGYVFAADPDAGDTTDTTLESIRQKLLQTGGKLTYKNAGFGNFELQTELADVCYGPKPVSLEWEPTGDNKACRVVFTVKVCVVECQGAQLLPGNIKGMIEYGYELADSNDQSGYTRRTYSCHARVAAVRKTINTFTLADHADTLRDVICPVLPFGFRRVSNEWRLSEDKAEIRGTVVDELLPPNAPQPGVVVSDGSHSVETDNGNLYRWMSTITATYEMARGRPAAQAFIHFSNLVKDRLDNARKAVRDPLKKGQKADVIPLKLRYSEPQLWGRQTASFMAAWSYITSTATAIAASGLWRPIPDSNYQQWAVSMSQAGVTKPRGVTNAQFDAKADALINFCNLEPVPDNPMILRPPPFAPPPNTKVSPFSEERPDPDVSWLRWRCSLNVEFSDETVELKPMPLRAVQLDKSPTSVNATNGYTAPYVPQTCPRPIVQVRAAPSMYVTLEGYAVRAGYDISPPELVSVGGVPVVPMNRPGVEFFRTQVHANFYTPVVRAEWRLRYLVAGIPTVGLGAPASPELGAVGDGADDVFQDLMRLGNPSGGK